MGYVTLGTINGHIILVHYLEIKTDLNTWQGTRIETMIIWGDITQNPFYAPWSSELQTRHTYFLLTVIDKEKVLKSSPLPVSKRSLDFAVDVPVRAVANWRISWHVQSFYIKRNAQDHTPVSKFLCIAQTTSSYKDNGFLMCHRVVTLVEWITIKTVNQIQLSHMIPSETIRRISRIWKGSCVNSLRSSDALCVRKLGNHWVI